MKRLDRLAVIGGRDFSDYKLMCEVLDKYEIEVIVSGGARGADSLGERYGRERGIEVKVFKADWDRYGKSAGFKRNYLIIDDCNYVIGFWDGKSKGTEHSLKIAKEKNKKIKVVRY